MKRILYYILICLVFFLPGCIKEDISDCNSELLLRFRYTLNKENQNLFGNTVSRVNIYVFTASGKYIKHITEGGGNLSNDFVMHVPLSEGWYHIIAYGGDFSTYTVGELDRVSNLINPTLRKNESDISDFRLELQNKLDADTYLHPLATPDDLFAGYVSEAIARRKNSTVTDVDIIRITKRIIVRLNGLSEADIPFDISITAPNSRYMYDYSGDTHVGIVKYAPLTSVPSEASLPIFQEAEFKIMRLIIGQNPLLIIKNNDTQQAIYNEDMIQLLLSTPDYKTQEDLDREDTFVFEFNIKNNVVVSVTINGWKIQNINPDI